MREGEIYGALNVDEMIRINCQKKNGHTFKKESVLHTKLKVLHTFPLHVCFSFWGKHSG